VQVLSFEPLQSFQSPEQDKRHNDNTSPQSLQHAIVCKPSTQPLRRSPRLQGSSTEVSQVFHIP